MKNNKPLNNKFNNTFNNKKPEFPSYLTHINLTSNKNENKNNTNNKNLLTKSRLNNINNAINDLLQTSESLKKSLKKENNNKNIKILNNSTEYFINNTKKIQTKKEKIKYPEPSDIDDNLTDPTSEFKYKNINPLDTHIFTEENTTSNNILSSNNLTTNNK